MENRWCTIQYQPCTCKAAGLLVGGTI